MIGQARIKKLLQREIPKSIILFGKDGSGKTTIANFINDKLSADLYIVEDLSVNSLKQITEDVSYSAFRRVYCIEKAEEMSLMAQNILLKTLEEVSDKVTFILCTSDRTKLLPTIMSRCSLIQIDRYSDADLIRYAETRCNGIDIKYCETPGDIQHKCMMIETGMYSKLIELTDLIVDKIHLAKVGNVFNIVNRLKVMDIKKRTLVCILNILIYEFRYDGKKTKLCTQFKYHVMNNNTDVMRTFEQLLVKLNEN